MFVAITRYVLIFANIKETKIGYQKCLVMMDDTELGTLIFINFHSSSSFIFIFITSNES